MEGFLNVFTPFEIYNLKYHMTHKKTVGWDKKPLLAFSAKLPTS